MGFHCIDITIHLLFICGRPILNSKVFGDSVLLCLVIFRKAENHWIFALLYMILRLLH